MNLRILVLILVPAIVFADAIQEAVSLTGKALYRPEIPPESLASMKKNLEDAKTAYEKNPDSADALIWYGRRTAYLGQYRDAIKIFTMGIQKHPRDSRMYRHRGHRYLTVREIDNAIRDFEKAGQLTEGTADQVEPDGIPNSRNIPRSTNHFNIWYHLGLAHYVKGDFEKAEGVYLKCLESSTNDDMLVATLHWLYMTLRRQGKKDSATELLKRVSPDMEIFEDVEYHHLLLMYKGVRTEESLKTDEEREALSSATIGYGVANWHFYNGDTAKARSLFEQIVDGKEWGAFGYLAAEAELAR